MICLYHLETLFLPLLMLRLYHLSQEQTFLEITTKIMESQAQMAAENPFGFGYLLNTISMYIQKPVEITLINTENSEIRKSLLLDYLPNSIINNNSEFMLNWNLFQNILSLLVNLLKIKLVFLFVKILLALYLYILLMK